MVTNQINSFKYFVQYNASQNDLFFRSQKKGQCHAILLTGTAELRDKLGPISICYNQKTNIAFNSVEVQQLGKILCDYLAPTLETTLIEIGCNFGVLSLMLAQVESIFFNITHTCIIEWGTDYTISIYLSEM